MLRRLAGLTSGTTADGAQTATPRIFGRRRAAEAKPPPESAPEGKGGAAGPAEAKGAPPTAADAKAGAAPPAEAKAGAAGVAAAKAAPPPLADVARELERLGATAYAAAASRRAAALTVEDLRAMRAPDLARLCEDLGFGAEAAAAYGAKFAEHGLDGWVAAEVDDWEDYAEVGLSRDHATVLCCVARAARGRAAAGAPAAPAAAPALSDAERAALAAADRAAAETGEGGVYGQLVVLGYKEYRVEGSTWHPVGARNEKFALARRDEANGIRRARARVGEPRRPGEKRRSADASHSVTMSVAAGARGADGKPVARSQRVTVEYVPDAREDMFQLGRMIVPQNDFVVRGPLHLDAGGVLCGPVSRYACRLSCGRAPPYACRLYAAGFNNERDVFLSEQAPKWQLAPGERAADADDAVTDPDAEPDAAQWDALTTFGVRIWKPEVGAWREVSVHGGVHEPRARADVAGRRYPDEDSVLTNGTIVDLAGIQLLFESAASMRAHERATRRGSERGIGGDGRSPIPGDPRADAPARIVARFNARRPQCPVQLHTIRLEYDDEKRRALAQDRRPYIFPACGHVHARAPRAAGRLLASAGPADIAGKEGRPAMRSTPSSSSQVRARAPAPAVPALPDARAVRRAPSRVGARHLRRRARGRL